MSDVEGLTTEERASLWAALIDTSDPWGLERAVESILAARVQAARAEAWDEGRNVGALDEHRWDPTPNPYRAAALRAEDAGGEGL